MRINKGGLGGGGGDVPNSFIVLGWGPASNFTF
jgi:hypothetical protein